MNDERVETPKQLAARIGLSERQIRHLVQTRQLEHVMVGSRVLIPVGAFTRFLAAKKVTPCQDETKVPVSVGSTNDDASISPGQRGDAVASARLALQIATKLKRTSPTGSKEGDAAPVRAIPMRST
jgi:excisionase family DNA binding protein